MKLLPLVSITFVAASSANAQFGPPDDGGPPPGANFHSGPHMGPNGWMGQPGDPNAPQPPTPESTCWLLHNPTGTWVNRCSETTTRTHPKPTPEKPTHEKPPPEKPTHEKPIQPEPIHDKPPQTVVPPGYSTPTPTTYAKTHPHVWHQRPRKLKARTLQDIDPWW